MERVAGRLDVDAVSVSALSASGCSGVAASSDIEGVLAFQPKKDMGEKQGRTG